MSESFEEAKVRMRYVNNNPFLFISIILFFLQNVSIKNCTHVPLPET